MYAASDWYHISVTPSGVHVHYLDPDKLVDRARSYMLANPELGENDAITQVLGHYSEAIREWLGFPQEWLAASGWECRTAPGRPDKLPQTTVWHDDLPEGTQQ